MKLLGLFFLTISFFSLASGVAIYEKLYRGIFGNLCEKAAKRFEKFGQCIGQLPAYQKLNSAFWYRAAKVELCGPSMKYHLNRAYQPVSVNATNSTSVPLTAIDLLSLPQNDTTAILQAQYLYNLRQQVAPQKSQETRRSNIFATSQTGTDRGSSNDSTEGDSGEYEPAFGEEQCLDLCHIIREGSNEVSQCWSNFALTALYAVCEIGCRFYI